MTDCGGCPWAKEHCTRPGGVLWCQVQWWLSEACYWLAAMTQSLSNWLREAGDGLAHEEVGA